MDSVLRLKPYQYAHILDTNSQVTRVVVGPATITKQQHETLAYGPADMVIVPPRYYCKIKNPVIMKDGKPDVYPSGLVKTRQGWEEIRFETDPFPLYPGEVLAVRPTLLTTIKENEALMIQAVDDFTDEKGVSHITGEEWLVKGPCTYIPRVEEKVIKTIEPIMVNINEAIVLEAINDFVDENGVKRITGEKWLYSTPGAYLPGINEVFKSVIKGNVITPTSAVHVKALDSVVSFGKKHNAGDHWLVTLDDTDMYIPGINEEVVERVPITTLTNRQFCVVLNPVDPKTGVQNFGARELRKGLTSFFLNPGETLEKGIQEIYILDEEEALLLRAISETSITDPDGKVIKKLPGERWLLYGPCEFIPSIDIEVVDLRYTIQIGENEGVYVRNIDNGSVRAVIGSSYLLKENEELWEKRLSPEVEAILSMNKTRKPYQVASFSVPDKAAVQVFDYMSLKSKIVFGPEMVLLQPYETFTVMNFSSGCPKKKNNRTAINLYLGPDFMNDIINVETSDHACLSLKLSYSWKFDYDKNDQEKSKKMFYSSDFVGDTCRILGSRIRSIVATKSFDEFHKKSSSIISEALFGKEKEIKFDNNLVIFGIDIQSSAPVEKTTRDSLMRSVQLAIEITTKSQEANARQEAERLEEESKSNLEREIIEYQTNAETVRRNLIEKKIENDALESSGTAIGEAKAKAAALKIEGDFALDKAKMLVEFLKEEFNIEFEKEKMELELSVSEK